MPVIYDEIRPVSPERIIGFLKEQDCCGCVFSVAALPERVLGSLVFPQTRVVIAGRNADILYRKFFLAFLSGGA